MWTELVFGAEEVGKEPDEGMNTHRGEDSGCWEAGWSRVALGEVRISSSHIAISEVFTGHG